MPPILIEGKPEFTDVGCVVGSDGVRKLPASCRHASSPNGGDVRESACGDGSLATAAVECGVNERS